MSNSVTTAFGVLQEALAVEQWVSEDVLSFSSLSIQLRAPLWPALAPDAFGGLDDFLRAMTSSPVDFYFADIRATKNYDASGNWLDPTFSADSAPFFGTAVPVDSAPVPEPATLLLVGAGLAYAERRRRRRT